MQAKYVNAFYASVCLGILFYQTWITEKNIVSILFLRIYSMIFLRTLHEWTFDIVLHIVRKHILFLPTYVIDNKIIINLMYDSLYVSYIFAISLLQTLFQISNYVIDFLSFPQALFGQWLVFVCSSKYSCHKIYMTWWNSNGIRACS